MAAIIGFEVRGVEGVKRSSAALVNDLFQAERRGTLKAALLVEREARRRLTAGRSRDPERLHVRSGALRASLNTSDVTQSARGLEARVGFRHGTVDKYAPVHEFGATIRAKSGGFLAIPIGAALTKGGSSKQRGPRAYPEGHFFRSKKGNLMFGIEGQAPLFYLVRSVTIPKRAPLGRSLATVRPQFLGIMDAELAPVAAKFNLG